MIKVCIFAEFPLSAIEGEANGRGGGQAATWLPQLAKAFEHIPDCEIHWGVFDRTAKRHGSQRCWNQTFHRIPTPAISLSLLLGRWPHRLAARKLLRILEPDLIHCWGTETLNGTALLHFDGPSILSMQGVINTYFKTGDLKGWRWRLFRRWELTSIRKASLVTSESRWGTKQVDGIVPDKQLRKVEYGVNPSFYGIKWQPCPDNPRILFVGSLNRLKGIDILLDMLKRHPERKWTMVFVGNGYLDDALLNLNDSKIEVLGILKTAQVQAEMAKAWVLAMPSRADTSPNVVKEARVIGLPVVGSPHGGHAEYIEHGKDGYIVPSEDPEAWFKALDDLCSDYHKCCLMGRAKHEWFIDYFRPEKTAEEFFKLYIEMTNLAASK